MNIQERMKIINNPRYKMFFKEEDFITPKPFKFNHKNEEITAIFETAYEEMQNSMICHRLNLLNKNTSVGYIKVFYLPEKTFDKLYPDVLHWLDNCEGHHFGLKTNPKMIDTSNNNFWSKKTKEEKKESLLKIAMYASYGCYKELNNKIDDIDVEKEYKNLLKIAEIKSGKNFKLFKKSRIDKPMIDFSKINKKDEYMHQSIWSPIMLNYCKELKIEPDSLGAKNEKTFQRTGLGEKMYSIMADWMALNKLPLCKGGTNHMSEPLWNKFSKNPYFNCKEDDFCTYIDHTKKDLSYLLKNNKASNKKKIKLI